MVGLYILYLVRILKNCRQPETKFGAKIGFSETSKQKALNLQTAFNSPKRLLMVEKGNKIRQNTLSLGLSRR
jgi:hypothetical protein